MNELLKKSRVEASDYDYPGREINIKALKLRSADNAILIEKGISDLTIQTELYLAEKRLGEIIRQEEAARLRRSVT